MPVVRFGFSFHCWKQDLAWMSVFHVGRLVIFDDCGCGCGCGCEMNNDNTKAQLPWFGFAVGFPVGLP